MRKKIISFCLIAMLFMIVSLTVPSPGFVPVDPNQPIRPLLLEDHSLKESVQAILHNPDLEASKRGEELALLAESYKDLSNQTEALLLQGIEHPVLPQLKSYFSSLALALTDMATAFDATDPLQLTQANERLKELDLEFQAIQN